MENMERFRWRSFADRRTELKRARRMFKAENARLVMLTLAIMLGFAASGDLRAEPVHLCADEGSAARLGSD